MAPAVGALGARRWAAVVTGLATFTTVCVTDLTPGLRFVAVGITLPALRVTVLTTGTTPLPALCVAVFIAGTTALAGSPVAVSLAGATTLAGPSTPDSDRKSTRLNSSHSQISYAVFCLKKKKNNTLRKAPIDEPHAT